MNIKKILTISKFDSKQGFNEMNMIANENINAGTNRYLLHDLGIDKIKKGDIAIFCGAGISLNSGLPSAGDLKSYILEKLSNDAKDRECILNSKLPFESLMGIIFSYYWPLLPYEQNESYFDHRDSGYLSLKEKEAFLKSALASKCTAMGWPPEDFFQMFAYKDIKPNSNHLLLAKLAQHGFLHTILTTNFDLLIEIALKGQNPPTDFKVMSNSQRITIENAIFPQKPSSTNIFKIHGSVENLESIRATLSDVSDKELSSNWKKTIEYIFKSGSHNTVIILGYSCSDAFDITPAIKELEGDVKQVILVMHSKNIEASSPVPLSITDTIFKHFPGWLVQCDTDDFVKALWLSKQEIIGEYRPVNNRRKIWVKALQSWGDSFSLDSNAFMRNFAMGQLMDSISNYRRAIIYWEKCSGITMENNENNALPIIYRNISSSYAKLSDLERSNQYARMASEIYAKINSL